MNNVDQFFSENAEVFSENYFNYLTSIFLKINKYKISNLIKTILATRVNGGTIFFIGNGGSASTASHFSNDISYGTKTKDKPIKSISLCDNTSITTALANDYGYDDIFIKQLQILAKPNDVLIAISASGNSENLIKAVNYANQQKIITCGLTAFDGGKLRKICKQGIHVPTEPKEYGPAEDVHMIIDHLVHAYLLRMIHKIKS